MFHGHHYQDGVSGSKRFWLLGESILYQDTPTSNWYDGTGSSAFLTDAAENYWFNTTEIVELDDYKNYLIVCQADTKTVGGTFKTLCYTNSPTAPLSVLAGADGYSDSGTAHYCKRTISYGDHLHLLHTREYLGDAWRDMFQRCRWSNLAHFTASADWNDVDTAGAGYKDLKTDYGAILNGELLGNTLYIYLEEAVYSCHFTGVASDPFIYEIKLPGVGLRSPRLLASNGDSHFFVGNDNNIYQYYGGRDKIPIGDPIKTEFFAALNTGSASGYRYADRAWAHILKDLEAVMFAIPTGATSSDPTLFYVYFWRVGRWEKWDYADTICGMGDYERPAGKTLAAQPVFTDSTGFIYKLDYSSTNDDATAIDAIIETKDFIVDLQNQYAVMDVWVDASGDGAASSMAVSLSVDGGVTYGDAETVTVGTTWDCYHVNFGLESGYSARLKFRNNTASQKLMLGRIKAELNRQDTEE